MGFSQNDATSNLEVFGAGMLDPFQSFKVNILPEMQKFIYSCQFSIVFDFLSNTASLTSPSSRERTTSYRRRLLYAYETRLAANDHGR